MGSEVIKFPTAAGVVVFGAAPTFRHLNPNVLLVKTDYWGFPKVRLFIVIHTKG